jgi:FecR protein
MGWLAIALAIALTTNLIAQPPQPQSYPPSQNPPPQYAPQGSLPPDENPDDPSRGVARISILQGDANVRRGDSGELVAAAVNAPLLAQDHIITAPGSRAEVELDSSNVVRLAPNTDLAMADLAYHKFQIQLAQGTIMYSIVRASKAETEIDTPSISIRPLGFGEYRISILSDGSTQVTVRAGQAEIFSPQGSEPLAAGRTMIVRNGSQGPEFQTTYAIAPDDFDQWNVVRDQQMQRSQSVRNVSPDIYGADDLDQYGRWVPSQYGQAWTPNDVDPNWAPYRDGQWTWADYYGWTWVDSAPWGWAPYHYGRWFWNGGYGWSWFPGPLAAAYYWRPALVGFFGFGAGFGLGFAFGNIGWCPLAPYEAFHPWYGRGYYAGYGRGFYNNTSIVNNANIASTYRNARVNNGVSYSSANRFGQGHQTYMAAHSSQLTQASLVRGQVPLSPSRQSLSFAGRSASANALPSSRGNQQFFMHQQPAPTQRVPFSTQASSLAASSQRTLGFQTNRGFTPAGTGSTPLQSSGQGFRRAESAGTGSSNAGSYGAGSYSASPRPNGGASVNSGGWHTFGQPGGARQTEMAPRPNGTPGQSADGWHGFGTPMHTPGSSGGNSYQPRNSYAGPSSSSSFNRSFQSSGGAQPLRINPPMVRPRESYSAPSYNYSAPRSNSYSAPHNTYSAPHYKAPKSDGGSHGSGGGSHGGGGGSHSGGGSHGHH